MRPKTMKKIIDVSELSVGMYVSRVTKSNGSATMKSQGLIKDESGIERLKELKVLEIEIDTTKSKQLIVENENALNLAPLAETNVDAIRVEPTTTFTSEIKRAREMYSGAREIQNKTFKKLQSADQLDIKQYEEVASEFLDSICRNQDALLCMTKLQDKDAYLLEHSINVGILLAIFSKHLGFSKEIGRKLTLAGILHDIGKAKVPDEVLLKDGRLTRDEFEEIKKHTAYGADILTQSGMDGLAVQIALQHHERLSGSGYPYGLIEHQINQYVRMSSIADVFDAITAERVYKKGMTSLQALKIIKDSGKSEYDGKLLNQFVQAIGLFSIGTVVLMKSQKLAIVIKTNYENSMKPIVTTFYNIKYKRHVEPHTIDLSSNKAADSIDKAVNPIDFDIDVNAIIERLIIDC